jgi:AcrR family transcriptional regulator
MMGPPPGDRRTVRREATRAEIVSAAWVLVREKGLAGLSLRELGARVGMRAQSLYSYFDSKDAIYDAMFRQGVEEQLAWMAAGPNADDDAADPIGSITTHLQRFFRFCTADPVRYQLLFQRTIPGFEPSAESYALAVEVLEQLHHRLRALGISDPAASDLFTAVATGLVSQQISNDPGGDRWERLIGRAVHMLVTELAPHLFAPEGRRQRRSSR